MTGTRRPGFWPWFLQRLTGAFLVVFLLYHLWVQHVQTQGRITFSRELRRFAVALYQATDVLLLLFVVFHGLNGLRNVLIDWGVQGRGLSLVTGFLWAFGAFVTFYGLNALWPFVFGHPFFFTFGGGR